MYAGAATTAFRNAVGTFLLFGGASTTKELVFGLEDYSSATFLQNTAASTVGACTGVLCTSPMDVVKTRIQNKTFGAAQGGFSIVREVVRTEGFAAFFKGISPKIVTAPKLVFSFVVLGAAASAEHAHRKTVSSASSSAYAVNPLRRSPQAALNLLRAASLQTFCKHFHPAGDSPACCARTVRREPWSALFPP
jgi:hypothetical protein